MNDAERWRTVAAWFEEAAATVGRPLAACVDGLCWALACTGPGNRARTNLALRRVMADREEDDSFLGPVYPKLGWRDMARVRATLALLMAHMAEDDGGNHHNEEG